MERVLGIADREIDGDGDAERKRVRRQRPVYGDRHLSAHPRASAASTSDFGSSFACSMQCGTVGRPRIRPARRVGGKHGGVLHGRLPLHGRRNGAMPHRSITAASACAAAPTSGSYISALMFLRSSSSRGGSSNGRDVVDERRFLDAVAAERMEHAAGIAWLEAVLPPQRLLRRLPDGPADQLPELDVRTGRRPHAVRLPAGAAMQNWSVPGAGGQVHRLPARHGKPLQGGALSLGDRHRRARERAGRERARDQHASC